MADFVSRLNEGLSLLERSHPAAARAIFTELVESDGQRAAGWIGLALACEQTGESDLGSRAIERALAIEPTNLWALLLKGDQTARTGNSPAAAAFYLNAIKLSPPAEHLPPPLRAALERARGYVMEQSKRVNGALELAFSGQPGLPERFHQSLEVLTGKREIYHSSPRYFHYSGLPSIEFHDRRAFPWLEKLESNTQAIKAELMKVMEHKGAFRPYIESSASAPRKSQDGLLDNENWSASYLIRNGIVQSEIEALCPITLASVRDAPLCDLPARSPSVLFSLLRPGAHIPPHCGLVNTRLIVHLPLIVPEGCQFRVGSSVREWREGEAWVFDDSIEHEAWNRSGQTRVILLFEIWRPELSETERAALQKLFATLDQQRGTPGDWEI